MKANWSVTNVSYSVTAVLALCNGVWSWTFFMKRISYRHFHKLLSKYVTPVDFTCWIFKTHWSPMRLTDYHWCGYQLINLNSYISKIILCENVKLFIFDQSIWIFYFLTEFENYFREISFFSVCVWQNGKHKLCSAQIYLTTDIKFCIMSSVGLNSITE